MFQVYPEHPVCELLILPFAWLHQALNSQGLTDPPVVEKNIHTHLMTQFPYS